MADCRDMEETLLGRVAGELNAREEAELDAHLAQCPSCRETLMLIEAGFDRFFPPMAEAPADLTEKALSFIAAFDRGRERNGAAAAGAGRRLMQFFFGMAAACLIFVVVFLTITHGDSVIAKPEMEIYWKNLELVYDGLERYNMLKDTGDFTHTKSKPFTIGLFDNELIGKAVQRYPESKYAISYRFNTNLSLDEAARAVKLGKRFSGIRLPGERAGSDSGSLKRDYPVPLVWTREDEDRFGNRVLVLFATGEIDYISKETIGAIAGPDSEETEKK